jgi:hypothetical protein
MDGSCFEFDILNQKVTQQLTGPDCDPIYSFANNSNFIYTSARDSIIRKYNVI